MRALGAIVIKEWCELAPASWLMVGVAGLMGYDDWRDPTLLSGITSLVLVGCGLGLWHGVLDRRFAASPFTRHRPVGAIGLQAARWAAGLSVLALAFPAYFLGRSLAYSIYAVESERIVQQWTAGTVLWAACIALLGWSMVRMTVAWPGRLAPVLWTLALPPAVATLLAVSQPALVPLSIALVLLFSVHQGVRLSCVR